MYYYKCIINCNYINGAPGTEIGPSFSTVEIISPKATPTSCAGQIVYWIRILITPLVSSNFSYWEWSLVTSYNAYFSVTVHFSPLLCGHLSMYSQDLHHTAPPTPCFGCKIVCVINIAGILHNLVNQSNNLSIIFASQGLRSTPHPLHGGDAD